MGKKKDLSREVRMQDGVTQGFAESVALKIYSGSTTELLEGVVAIELTIEMAEARAVRALAAILSQKLMLDGYIVTSDIDHALEETLEKITAPMMCD